MRKVKLTFITTIPDAETDDHAYLMADAEVSQLDPPGDWVFEGMEVVRERSQRFRTREATGQINIYDYDPDTGELIQQRPIGLERARGHTLAEQGFVKDESGQLRYTGRSS